jgi:Flp pilus assembly protein TadB
MHHALAALADTTATPIPVPTVDPELVTPGPWGFLVIVLLAAVVILLVWDMMRRIRRGRVRADIQEELDAEQKAADAGSAEDGSRDGASSDEPDGAPRG